MKSMLLIKALCVYSWLVPSNTAKILDYPEISVAEFMTTDDSKMRNDSDNTGDDNYWFSEKGLTVTSNVLTITLTCRAEYPVFWLVENTKSLEETTETFIFSNIFTFTARLSPPSSDGKQMFEAKMRFWTLFADSTGNYSCQSVDTTRLKKSSIFIFSQGGSRNNLINAGDDHFRVFIDGKDFVETPCSVSNEATLVKLYKKTTQETPANISSWTILEANSSIKFDPTKGFILKVFDLPEILGYYKCISDDETETENDDQTDVVYFEIELQSKADENHPVPNHKLRTFLRETASMKYYADTASIVCCSNSNKKPELKVIHCENPTDCDIAKHTILNKKLRRIEYSHGLRQGLSENCTEALLYLPTFLVSCIGDGVDVFQEYYYSFGNETSKQQPFFNTPIGNYNIRPVTDQAPLDDLIMIFYKIEKPNAREDENALFDDDLFLMIAPETNSVSSSTLYSGLRFMFKCYYSYYMFSTGVHLKIQWKNGTEMLMKGPTSEYIFGVSVFWITLDANITAVTCIAPLWNSSIWFSKDMKVAVTAPVNPQINGPINEEVYWTLNATDVVLNCDITQGDPVPSIKWARNGIAVANSSNIQLLEFQSRDNLIRSSSLKFLLVTHELQGSYTCTSENVLAKTSKTFLVFVNESQAFHVLSITVGTLLLLIIFATSAFFAWRSKIYHRILSNLRSTIPEHIIS